MQTIDFTPLDRPADPALRDQLRAEARAGEWGRPAQRMAKGMLKGGYWKDFARLTAFAKANGFAARPAESGDELEDLMGTIVGTNWRCLGVRAGRRFQVCQVALYDDNPSTFIEVLSAASLPRVQVGGFGRGELFVTAGAREQAMALLSEELRDALARARMGFRTTTSAMYAQATGGRMDDVDLWRAHLAVIDAMASALDAREAGGARA